MDIESIVKGVGIVLAYVALIAFGALIIYTHPGLF